MLLMGKSTVSIAMFNRDIHGELPSYQKPGKTMEHVYLKTLQAPKKQK